MRLYVGNGTDQVRIAFFRLDFNSTGERISQVGMRAAKQQKINAGQQESLGGDLDHVSQIDTILSQLEKYGIVKYDEVNRARDLCPFIYRIDQPVPQVALDKLYRHNKGVLQKQGEDLREKASIAAASVIESPEAKISFEQMEESENNPNGSRLEQGFLIDKTANARDLAARTGRKVVQQGRRKAG